jgi:hypothetical protein
MARGRKTGGRTKGTPNKATAVVRADLKEISDEPIITKHELRQALISLQN